MTSVLDDTYELIVADILKMSKYVSQNYNMALECLLDNDKDKAMHVYEQDEIVNQLEDKLNQQIVLAIARYQPVATDLRKLIGAIKLISDIERIGDYAKSMAKTVLIRNEGFVFTNSEVDILKKMHSTFIELFAHTMDAFVELEANKVYDIVKLDEQINELLNTALSLQLSKIDSQTYLEQYLMYINILRKIERAGDHTKNICEIIVYICNGTRLEL